jgi:transcriptional regulator with XRE-family HTH domain
MTMHNFQTLLKQERIIRGWSQAHLGRKIGASRVTINRWENGSTIPTPFFWPLLSELLGKPIEELFPEISGEPSRNQDAPLMLPERTHSTLVPTIVGDGSQKSGQEQLFFPSRRNPPLLLNKEQDQFQPERENLELIEKRMELQQKQFLYARNKIDAVLEMLEPQIDPDIRMMVLEATFSYLEELPLTDELSISLPPFRWIRETLEAVKQEYAPTPYAKEINITPEQLEGVLDHLGDLRLLGESDLVYMRCVALRFGQEALTSSEKGAFVREVLDEALERLQGNSIRSDTAPEWRLYNILYYRYFRYHLKNEQISARLGMTSTRHYFRERKKALEALLNALLEMEAAARSRKRYAPKGQALKAFDQQHYAYRFLIDLISRREVKEAVLIQFSCTTSLDVVRVLLSKGARVTVFVQHEDTAMSLGSQFQAERIKTTTRGSLGDLKRGLSRPERLKVYQFHTPSTISAIKIDNRVLCMGWYTYEHEDRSASRHYPDDTVALSGHDRATLVVWRGTEEFDALDRTFRIVEENYRNNSEEVLL